MKSGYRLVVLCPYVFLVEKKNSECDDPGGEIDPFLVFHCMA